MHRTRARQRARSPVGMGRLTRRPAGTRGLRAAGSAGREQLDRARRLAARSDRSCCSSVKRGCRAATPTPPNRPGTIFCTFSRARFTRRRRVRCLRLARALRPATATRPARGTGHDQEDADSRPRRHQPARAHDVDRLRRALRPRPSPCPCGAASKRQNRIASPTGDRQVHRYAASCARPAGLVLEGTRPAPLIGQGRAEPASGTASCMAPIGHGRHWYADCLCVRAGRRSVTIHRQGTRSP
jgi:hypothetical protein